MDFNKFAKEVYEQNKLVGWWDDPNRCIYETLQLFSTEVSEATEGERKDLMDTHLSNRKMGEVELADALIRILDLGGKFSWKYYKGVKPHCKINSVEKIAAHHLVLNMAMSDLAYALFVHDLKRRSDKFQSLRFIDEKYSAIINTIVYIAEKFNYDLVGAALEKFEYNKHRADHKRENRSKKHGKSF